jgi:hypothetical protein
MKRFATLILALSFLLIAAVTTVAQVTCVGDNQYAGTDTWYYVDPKGPYLEAFYSRINSDFYLLGGEYFKNDHTFLDVMAGRQIFDTKQIAGSYLFKPGFFIGGLYTDVEGLGSAYQISPGFRLGLGGPSYFAVSLDYLSNPTFNGITGYDARVKFFVGDTLKFAAAAYFPQDGKTELSASANVKLMKILVIGGNFFTKSNSSLTGYDVGLTFKPSILIIDGSFGQSSSGAKYFDASGMIKLGDSFKVGAQYEKYENLPDGLIELKGAFILDDFKLVLKYGLSNNTYTDSQITAAFEMNL